MIGRRGFITGLVAVVAVGAAAFASHLLSSPTCTSFYWFAAEQWFWVCR